MTEKSWFWGGTTPGDAADAPYDNDEWSDLWRKLFMTDRTTQGKLEGYENELLVSNPSGNNIRVATGAALVDGKVYETDANVDNTISTPAVSTRIDRIVLQKSWSAQTIRVAVLTGVEGGGVPTVTQTDGVTWEIPLAQVSITTGAVITITDERQNARTPLAASGAAGMVEIETIEGDGTGATIDFTSIPTTFRHLLIIGQARFDGAVTEALIEVRFNNDSGANYNEQDLFADGVSAVTNAAINQNEITLGKVPGASATANHAGQLEAMIPNYDAENLYHTISGEYSHIRNDTIADFETGVSGGQWKDTTAINRITLLSTTASADNFDTGSIFTLYGLP